MKLIVLLLFSSLSCFGSTWQKSLEKKWDFVKADRFYNKGSFILKEKGKKKGKQYLLVETPKKLAKKATVKSVRKNMCKKNKCKDGVLFTPKGASFVAKSLDKSTYNFYLIVPSKIKKNFRKEHGKNISAIAKLIVSSSKRNR